MSHPPPAFWDTLSIVWLTKGALRELDRRNTQPDPSSPTSSHQRARQPLTRNFFTESKRNYQTTQYTADYLRYYEPGILKDIELFARHGGPDLSDLRNYSEPIQPFDHMMSSSPSRQQGSVDPQKSTPYSRNFQQHLIQHGVYPCGYKHRDGSVPAKPDNWKEIKQILVQRRPSLSPSKFTDEEYERFFQDDVDASKEKDVSVSVIPMIEGNIADKKCHSGGIPFGNLNPLINSAVKLTSANPDVYYGASLEQLSQKAVDELGGRIIPSTQHDLPILPNFFLEVKGPDGSLAVAGRQACYVGALGARAVHSLQSYGQEEPVYDNNAYTITSIYHGGALKMYTSHVTQPRSSGGRPRYHMNHLASFSLAGDRDTCVAGLQAYRNGRQWAEKQRNEAIRQANERANIVEGEVPDGDAVATRPAIFTTAVSETKTYNMRQESRTSLDDDYSTLEGSEDSDSPDELAPLPVKRAKRYSKNQQIKQNQRNANVSSEAGRRDGSAVTDPPWSLFHRVMRQTM